MELYVDMTIDNYGSVWEIDLCYHLLKGYLSNERALFKSTPWIKLRPRFCSENTSKGSKNSHHLLQQIKSK